jgi:pilus assembly protein CpaB
MPRKTIFIIASVFFAILAVVAANIYLSQRAQEVKQQAQQEVAQSQAMRGIVVIAKGDIAKGTTLEPDMLDTKLIIKDYLEPRAVQYPERIVGMVTLVPVSQGEQITFNKLMSPKEVSISTSLAMSTPVGKRAISLPVDNLSSLMGMIRTGDHVDVLATIPVPSADAEGKQTMQPAVVPLFQDVLVLAIDQQSSPPMPQAPSAASRYGMGGGGGGPAGTPQLITLALTPQEANILAFVQEQGKIRLALRSPADSNVEPVQMATWENLFAYLVPQAVKDKLAAEQEKQLEEQARATMAIPEPPPKKLREIEIYRGVKKESIPVSGSHQE